MKTVHRMFGKQVLISDATPDPQHRQELVAVAHRWRWRVVAGNESQCRGRALWVVCNRCSGAISALRGHVHMCNVSRFGVADNAARPVASIRQSLPLCNQFRFRCVVVAQASNSENAAFWIDCRKFQPTIIGGGGRSGAKRIRLVSAGDLSNARQRGLSVSIRNWFRRRRWRRCWRRWRLCCWGWRRSHLLAGWRKQRTRYDRVAFRFLPIVVCYTRKKHHTKAFQPTDRRHKFIHTQKSQIQMSKYVLLFIVCKLFYAVDIRFYGSSVIYS